ncbi:MAG: murein biosynthesis integral membrane protein MurJ [Cellulomonadaceae bacterium]
MRSTAQGSGGGLGRSSMVMAAGTAVSRVLGFVRNILLVGAIGGTGVAADAFDVANKIPNMLFAVIGGGVLNAILVPQIVKAYQRRNGDVYVNKLLTFACLVLLVITTLLTASSALLVGVMAGPNWSDGQRALAIAFALWCIPQLFFYGLYTLLGQLLNARKQFGPFMWAPALNNIVSIAGFALFIAVFGHYAVGGPADDLSTWTGPKIALLAGTATLGIVSQALILVWPLLRSGFRFRLLLDPRGVGLRSAGKVAAWTLASVVIDQLGVVATTRIASSAPIVDGTSDLTIAGNAAYSQALLIYLLPHSLVTVSIATALFTGLSAAAQRSDHAEVRRILSQGVRTVGVFTVFATALMAVLAVPLTKMFVPTINAAAGHAVAQVLVAMCLGLVPLGVMVLVKWVFFAYEDGRTVFWIQIPMTVVLVSGSLAVMTLAPQQWWVVGIAGSMAASNAVAVALRVGALRRILGGLDGARIVRLHVRAGFGALVSAAVGWGVLRLFGDLYGLSWGRSTLICLVVTAVMTVVYVALLHLFHVRELTALAAPLHRILRRRR